MVGSWSYTAGYDGIFFQKIIIIIYSFIFIYSTVVEMGDEIERIVDDKALVMINHQSTSDVPLIMAAFDGRCRNVMWIMDRMFMRTNFGIVSWFHKDFFISSVILLKYSRIDNIVQLKS